MGGESQSFSKSLPYLQEIHGTSDRGFLNLLFYEDSLHLYWLTHPISSFVLSAHLFFARLSRLIAWLHIWCVHLLNDILLVIIDLDLSHQTLLCGVMLTEDFTQIIRVLLVLWVDITQIQINRHKHNSQTGTDRLTHIY